LVGASVFTTPYNTVTGTLNNFCYVNSTGGTVVSTNNTPISVFVPQATRSLHRTSLSNMLSVGNTGSSAVSANSDGNVLNIATNTEPSQIILLRAGADDCSFSNFVSIPPMYAFTGPA